MSKKCKFDWSDIDGASPKPIKTASLGKGRNPTVCITAQYKNGTMIDFKVKEDAENMLIPSTVDSFTLTKKLDSKKITDWLKVARTFPLENAIQDQTSETTKYAVKLLPSFSLSCEIGEVLTKWLTGSGGGCKKDRAAQQIVT